MKSLKYNTETKHGDTSLNPNTSKAESHEDLSCLKLAWTTSRDPGNPDLQREMLLQKQKQTKKTMLVIYPSLKNTRTWKEGRGHRHVE